MKSIKLRVLLLLLYLVVLGVYLYPQGASLSDPAGVQWLAVMGGTLLVIVLLFLVLRYRERRRDQAEYGYYPKDEKNKTER
ncbi:MAG: hypothetical protein ACFNT7_00940 [Porphyromonas pasteri]|jgi:hypothetical protein